MEILEFLLENFFIVLILLSILWSVLRGGDNNAESERRQQSPTNSRIPTTQSEAHKIATDKIEARINAQATSSSDYGATASDFSGTEFGGSEFGRAQEFGNTAYGNNRDAYSSPSGSGFGGNEFGNRATMFGNTESELNRRLAELESYLAQGIISRGEYNEMRREAVKNRR